MWQIFSVFCLLLSLSMFKPFSFSFFFFFGIKFGEETLDIYTYIFCTKSGKMKKRKEMYLSIIINTNIAIITYTEILFSECTSTKNCRRKCLNSASINLIMGLLWFWETHTHIYIANYIFIYLWAWILTLFLSLLRA